MTGATNTADLLRAVAREHGGREAFVEIGRRITFAEWNRAADGVARLFHERGVRKGDVVALLLPSSIDYAICYQAAMRLGAITSGINTRFGPRERNSILTRCDARVIVCDHGIDLAPPFHGAVVGRGELAAAGALEPVAPIPLGFDDAVCVVWTSGTTGEPKGALFDYGCLKALADAPNPLVQGGDRRLNPLPFPHVGYMTRAWDEIEHLITTVISPTPWTAESMLRLIQDERVTVGQGVPTQWRLVLNHPNFDSTDFSSLRICGSGAQVVPPELVREIKQRLHVPVAVGYSSTESSMCSSAVLSDDLAGAASVNIVGRPYKGVEISVVTDSGEPVAPGEVGNVRCRSRAMMRGYWKDPERTRDAISPDGWCTLGDLGYVDSDGNLVLVGRRKEMYIRGGYNVYPAEVEAALGDHPAVDRVAVVGIPDPVLGEIGVAFVVPVAGQAAPELGELRAFCRDRIADYKAPDRLELVGELPVNAMMKVDKQTLIERITGER